MGLDREIDAIRRRLNKIVPIVSPPELKMHIVQAGMELPEAKSPWEMVLRIEDKNPAFNS